MKKPITLVVPPEALERITVSKVAWFFGSCGLTLDAEIRDGQIVMTARPIPDMENMETFGSAPTDGAA